MEKISSDVVIVGAGASGLMAAHFASLSGKTVSIINHNKEIGRKILITGGGRCNFTNKNVTPESYQSSNSHFVKSALSRFTPYDFIDIVERHKIKYFEKKLGQLFCKDSANEITALLSSLINKSNISLYLKQKNIIVDKTDFGFNLHNQEISINTKSLIIATGGLTFPSLGSTNFGYKVAKKFGHKIIPCVPALVPFTTPEFTELSGISLNVKVTCNEKVIEEDILFTHKGLSGPVILKSSLNWNHGDDLIIDWLPSRQVDNHFNPFFENFCQTNSLRLLGIVFH